MKQTVFKQLLLLAVFLFAGIGSAFGQDENYFQVEVNRVDAAGNAYPEEFDEVQVIFEREGFRVNIPEEAAFPKGYVYKMSIDNLRPDIYTVTSIVINGTPYEDPGKYVNSENYIKISDPSDNLTVTVTISKVETKTITVHRNSSLANIDLFCKDNDDEYYDLWISPMTSDEEKEEFEVLSGSSCRLKINLRNSLAYTVSSVSVGGEVATEEFNNDGHVIISSIDDDIDVYVEVAKAGDTKTISLSIMPDEYGRVHGTVRFYGSSRDVWSDFGDDAELLVGSTTQMTIKTELGWKVSTLKVDGTDVTETYNGQGYYEFKNLNADHSVSVELGEAEIYTITVYSEDNIEVDTYIDDNWAESGTPYEFNEGSFVTLSVRAYALNAEGKQIGVRILDGETDVTPDSPDEEDFYNYTIKNLKTNHEITLTYEMLPSITVNCFYNGVPYDNILFSLNDEEPDLSQPCGFIKGTDVTFSLRWIPEGKVVESIKIDDDNDITSKFNGSYLFNNLTEDHVITVTLSKAEASYYFNAYFDESSTGTIYLKKAMTEKEQTNGMDFVEGSVATLFVKVPIGYEVSNIHLIMYEVYDENGELVSDRIEEDAAPLYDDVTNEYYCEVTITAPTEAIITTQKKPGDGTTDMFIDDSGMVTFCSEYDLDFSTEATKDIAAYVAIGYNSETNKLKMMRVTEAQRGTGLLVIGKPGSYTIPMKETSLSYQNLLKAVGEETIVPETEYDKGVDCDNYVLLGSEFVKADETPIPAYQAYLQLPRHVACGTELISIELIDMGDMNGDTKITITDAVMIVDKILNEQ